ncbi:probable E3 ubiquitin-protein ligase HERC4 isoform X1 [Tachysurus fulvidraco]|uniref:probable E3 ubiquitin-protein ligase HERC4 isoform X1 n=1 Tax=Tachysurus fulvidraco TaxID=1234273 RepID=UPI001FEDB71F|nr:probable E3 ubiquitin-protein ligase HERC4 isoform X1 [Tachysurus fulvidraco]
MMFYCGETVKPDGFGLVNVNSVKFTDTGTGYFCPKSRIRDVSLGKNLVGFIRADGNASVMRLGDHGNVGKLKPLDQKKDKIRLISCGEAGAVLLTYGGRLLSLEKAHVCRPIKELSNETVIRVACGNHHFMALTNDGKLFTWGQNSNGQLGLGGDLSSSPSPRFLKSLCGIPLAQISAGGDHSFALSLSGAVFGWGKNNAGQLGLGHTNDVYSPTCVNSLSQKKTISISCGEEHTATLSKGGTVFTFGSGRFGQLGHNSLRDELRPRVLSGLSGSNVSQIACGRHHTLALVKLSNTIYSFGCGEQGQLGNGQRTNQSVPLPVQLPPAASNSHTLERIIAGGNRSFIMSSPQNSEPEPNRIREIVTLGDRMIHRWVTECESNQWTTIKKEIKTVFSSLACINGSFIMNGCDRHYQTSTHFSGLNMESVKSAFDRLAEKERVLLEVKKVVEKDLLPTLGFTDAGVEALRVFLILPELLRVLAELGHETKLTASYASAVLNLNPGMLGFLENFWSELPEPFLKTIVKLFQTSSGKMISEMMYGKQNNMYSPLCSSLQVLQMLYKASCRNQRSLTPGDFIIYEINELFDMLYAVQTDITNAFWTADINVLLEQKQHYMQTLKLLISSPCVFTLETKYRLLKFREPLVPFRMELSRTTLLEDCFDCLRNASEQELKGWLQVVYCENYEKSDVNKRDFFHNAFKTLLDPESKMFMYNDTKTHIWFPVELSLPEDTYFFLGLLCGLAFYNNSVVPIPIPLALFKKLLDIEPTLDDFAEISPVEARSLQYIRDYSDDDAENMGMIYTITWNGKQVELDPDEPEKAVTSSNKNVFVDTYVDYVLNKSVERVFNEFKKGFYKVCERSMVNLFQPEELRGVMLGSEEYEWDALKKNATYAHGFDEDHPTIVLFWEVFDELSDQDKKAFLLFVTGFDRVPILGMAEVKMTMRPLFYATQDYLPQALTCHTILDLPIYQSKEILQMKLTEAIHHKRGFWED